MRNREQRIINKIFKVLPIYEESVSYYPNYLHRIIIELSGEAPSDVLDETIVALKGLEAQGANVTHSDVKGLIFYHIDRLKHMKGW